MILRLGLLTFPLCLDRVSGDVPQRGCARVLRRDYWIGSAVSCFYFFEHSTASCLDMDRGGVLRVNIRWISPVSVIHPRAGEGSAVSGAD